MSGNAVAATGAGTAPAAGGGNDAAAAGQQAQAQAGGWSMSSIIRLILFYYMISSFFRSPQQAQPVKDPSTGVMLPPHRPAWSAGTRFDLYVYVHDSDTLDPRRFTSQSLNPSRLVWLEKGLEYGWGSHGIREETERAMNWTILADSWPLPFMQANNTLYAHVFMTKDRRPLFEYREAGMSEEGALDEDIFASESQSALVVAEDGSATSLALSHTAGNTDENNIVPPLTPLPSPSSPNFSTRFRRNPRFDARAIIHRSVALNTFRPPPKEEKKRNLLGRDKDAQLNDSKEVQVIEKEDERAEFEEEEMEPEIPVGFGDEDDMASGDADAVVASNNRKPRKSRRSAQSTAWLPYWKPFLHIRPIPDWTTFPHGGIPAEMRDAYVIDPKTGLYEPIIYFDYFWLLQEQLVQINGSVNALGLNLTTSPLSLMKWRLECQMEESWKMQQGWGMQEADGRESEMLKRMIMDTNVYLLALTFAVSLLHTIFDFLAFKSDISFWKNVETMKGLSTRSILMNAICQVIIFLYLLDNDTSWMILGSSAVGLVIEFWKVKKALVVRIDRRVPFPHIRILNASMSEDKAEEDKTEDEKELELHAKYDAEAMRYLSWVLYPLLFGYACYSLYYESHKSWYSFILSVLTGCVYTFGFIMMCPQLYLNYKLKSVAHLPWRMLTYKALNTFIDDLFAFIIKMPTLHRLACFRDDIIFFIFLYQKWIYRVDYKRANEFGCVLVTEEEKKKMEEEERQKALGEQSANKREEEMKQDGTGTGTGAEESKDETQTQADSALQLQHSADHDAASSDFNGKDSALEDEQSGEEENSKEKEASLRKRRSARAE